MVADPIEAITAVRKKPSVSSTTPILPAEPVKKKKSDFLYSVNYVIAVMEATQVCMKHQQDVVAIRSKLAEITTKIQADMNIINQYMTTIQSNAKAPAGEGTGLNAYNGFGPANNGFAWYNSDGTVNVPAGGALDQATTGFINAFKDLYVCSPAATPNSGVTVASLFTMDNPVDPTKPFDMTNFWTKINPGYNAGSNLDGFKDGFDVIDINPKNNTTASLMMQYIFWQGKLNLAQADPQDIMAAGTDFSKLPGMDFDLNGSCDPTVKNMMLPLQTTFNVVSCFSDDPLGNGNIAMGIQEGIAGNKYWLYHQDMTLAYNYFLAKDPSGKDTANVDFSSRSRKPGSDLVSDMYTKISSTQATLSSASSSQGTDFQQDTSGMTTETNEVQQIISSFMQGQGSLVGNFKSG